MKKIIISLIALSMFFSLEAQQPIKKNKKTDKNATFMDKIKTKDPEIQKELDRLKKEFIGERELIHKDFELKKDELKEKKKEEMSDLRDLYMSKIENLKKEHPEKIETKKHLKPLNKNNSNFLDPRDEKNNTISKVKKKGSKDKNIPLKSKK